MQDEEEERERGGGNEDGDHHGEAEGAGLLGLVRGVVRAEISDGDGRESGAAQGSGDRLVENEDERGVEDRPRRSRLSD